MRWTRRGLGTGLALAMLMGAAATGCGDDDTAASDGGGIEVTGAWARTSPTMATAGAVYFAITSSTGDVLLAASVDPSVAAVTEIHETVAVDADGEMSDGEMSDGEMSDGEMSDGEMSDGEMSDDMSGHEMDTAMTMRPLHDGLALPAGETVHLEPGGYHVMLLQLVEPLEAGDTITLELDFETAPDQTIDVTVSDTAP